MLDAALERALFNRPPIWATGAGDWWDFTGPGRAKRGVGAQPAETRASDGWAENEAGLLVRRSANTRSMAGKGLLTYPTAQNYVSAPSDFSNAFWGKDALTILTDQAANFDGSVTMDKLVETAASSAHQVYNYSIVTATSGAWYTAYGYARIGERGFLRVNPAGSGSPVGSTNTFYDQTTGVVTQGGNADVVGRMSPAGNGLWYCELSVKAASAAGLGFQLAPAPAVSNIVYAGDAAKGVYVGGWNFRAGQFGVPPIDSAATANGPQQVIDIGSRASGGVGGVIQVNMLGTAGLANPYLLAINDGTGNNRFVIFYNGTSIATAQTVGGVGGSSITVAAAPATGLVTIAYAASPSYQMARVVGYSAPSSIAGSYAGSALTKFVLGGNGFDAASNIYQRTLRAANWYGPMSQHFFDNVLWPKAQLLAQVA